MIAEAGARALAVLPRLETSSPAPKVPSPDSVTPGVWGFVVIFLIAVVVILLVMDMTRRIRRVRYRAEIAAKLDAEESLTAGGGHSDVARAADRTDRADRSDRADRPNRADRSE